MTRFRFVGPRCAWLAGSAPSPEYASTSVSRTVTPFADRRQPSSVRAVSATFSAGASNHAYRTGPANHSPALYLPESILKGICGLRGRLHDPAIVGVVSISAARFRYTLVAGATAVVIGAGFTLVGLERHAQQATPSVRSAQAPLAAESPQDDPPAADAASPSASATSSATPT